jgi:hypothetical protein
MSAHDWTRVEAGIIHALHAGWLYGLQNALNGLLTQGYYALAEQHFGQGIPDILTLHSDSSDPTFGGWSGTALPDSSGVAVAETPPRTRRRHTVDAAALTHRRTLSIRHVSGHRLVAMIEIVSPANKDRARNVSDFSDKVVAALGAGVSVLVVDLFPPGQHDPFGLHDAILHRLEDSDQPYDLPADEPLTLASYCAGQPLEIYLDHLAVGGTIPEMPLFLNPDRYINVPLEATYASAYVGMPAFWREVLERQ